METDPASLDPEERMNKWYALASVALGALGLCMALIPACGGVVALLGFAAGYAGLKSESRTTALFGMWLSLFSLILALTYGLFTFLFVPPN